MGRIEVVEDPIRHALEEYEKWKKEGAELVARLERMQSEQQDIVEETKDRLPENRMDPEDVEKAIRAAREEFGKQARKWKQQLEQDAHDLVQGERLSYRPSMDADITVGRITFPFRAGKESRYPRVAIKAYENYKEQIERTQWLDSELRASTDPNKVNAVPFGRVNQILKAL